MLFRSLFWQVNKLASHLLSGMATMAAGTAMSAVLGSAVTAGALLSGGAALAGAAGAGLSGGAWTALKGAQGMIGGSRSMRGAMGMLTMGGRYGGRLGAATSYLTQGARQQMRSTALSRGLGNFAGWSGQRALTSGTRSLRQFADVARYSGQDHAGWGARR